MAEPTESIVLGGGCFWCTEAVFSRLRGVVSAVSGYAGGTVPNPTYEQVCEDTTGHAEVSRVEFDPGQVSLDQLLEVFFYVHDPTSLNRQGADVGTQYRSIILYTQESQRPVIERRLRRAQEEHPRPVVTQVGPLEQFYPAEAHHQHYFERHPSQGYCALTIQPKVAKAERHFPELLRG